MSENPTDQRPERIPHEEGRSAEQIVAKLRQADVELGKGLKVPEVCKQLGITVETYYRWPQTYGGMAPEPARQMKGMEKENVRLKKLVAEQALDNQILKEMGRRRARRGVLQGHAPRRVNPAPVGQFKLLVRRIAAPSTRSIPTSSNMPAGEQLGQPQLPWEA